jgi:hypothetical protein
MRKHLYQNKKPCATIINDIELTDDIKDHIINFRVYHIPQEAKVQPINQTINHYNTMNNFIANMDVMDKLTKYVTYKQIDLIPFERSVETRYLKTKQRLENDIGIHQITQDDIIEIIDELSKMSDNVEDFNIMYDSKLNKLLLYDAGDWKEMFLTSGLKSIIRTIQDYFWHAYECYLIRKIKNMDIPFGTRAEYKNRLIEYYVFIASLDIDPYVKDRNNNQINYSSDDDRYWREVSYHDLEANSLQDEFMKEYRRVKDNMTRKEIDRLKKDLLDLIKRNSKKNINELNKTVMTLINVDEEFQKLILNHQGGNKIP